MQILTAIIPLFFCFGQANAHEAAEGQIHISLGSLTYQTQFKNDRGEVEAPVQGSAGFVVNGDLDENGSLEVGGFYLDKVFLRQFGSNILVEKSRRVYMTLGYRHWFTNKFSASLSSFTSYAMGDPTRIHSTTGGDPGFLTSAHDTSDHGIDASISYEAYDFEEGFGIVNIHYSKSLSDREGEDGDHIALYLAYKKRAK